MFKPLKRIWTRTVKFRTIKSKCLKSSSYHGEKGHIVRIGQPDLTMWCVVAYDTSDISRAVKAFGELDKAVNRFIEVEYE